MQIITKSIRIIDYDAQQIYTRATPATFDVYVSELIDHSFLKSGYNSKPFSQ